jgi:hypothetical protein
VPEEPELEARVGDDGVNFRRISATSQYFIESLVLVNIDDKDCMVEIVFSQCFIAFLEYS